MEQFEKALYENKLDDLAIELHKEGLSRKQIYNRFEEFLIVVQKRNISKDEDHVLDIMDRIWGFCGEEYVLPLGEPDYLTNEIFKKI